MTKSNKPRVRRDWQRTLFLIVSVLIVLTMLLSLVLTFAPSPGP